MKRIVRQYDSVFQFTEYLNHGTLNTRIWRGEETIASEQDNADWAGTSSFDEAQHLFTYGDRKSMELIKEVAIKNRLNDSGSTTRTTIRASVAGFMPNVANYIAGHPNAMYRRVQETKTSCKVLNVLYNCCFSGSRSAKTIVESGVKVLEFVNEAEKKGYRCNLYASVFAEQENESMAMLVKIKSSSQPLDLLKVSYPIINPSFLRRHFFKCLEIDKEITCYGWAGSYGFPVTDWQEVRKTLDKRIKVDYYFCSQGMTEIKER